MTTPLGNVTGIGPKTADYLRQQGIDSVEALLRADISVLVAAPGFGESRANTVMSAARTLIGKNAPPTKVPASVRDKKGKKKKKAGEGGKKKKADKGAKDSKKSGKDGKKKDKKKNKKGKKKKK